MIVDKLKTEERNSRTTKLDDMSTSEILKVMNEEDLHVLRAVQENLPEIEKAVEYCYQSIHSGGRMIYMGAGTSGRIGVMDAVECIPTFSSENVIGCMAGGPSAFIRAKENVEDDPKEGKKNLIEAGVTSLDTVIGLAASGRTPSVIGGLKYAQSVGASTISIACNSPAEISKYSALHQ